MRYLLAIGFSIAMLATPALAQDVMANPAINPETFAQLQGKIAELEKRLAGAKEFVEKRKPELLQLKDKIDNADADTQKVIDDLNALVNEFKTGSEIQLAVEKSMQDVRGYIDKFRAGSAAQQAAAASLTETLATMEKADARRNDQVGKALTEIRRLEAMKGDLIAFRIAGAFAEMGALYDEMIDEFGTAIDATKAVSDALQSATTLPTP